MALSTFVKISEVSNLSDARYCSGMGVDQLGFNFNAANPNAIAPKVFLEIKNWVAGVDFVGEFEDMSSDQIIDIQKDLPLDLIEISDKDALEAVHLLGKPISFKLNISHQAQIDGLMSELSYLDELAEQVILECSDESLFSSLDSKVSSYHGRLKLIRGYDVSEEAIDNLNNFKGIQLKGTPEEQPGFKDYGEVMDILEELEVD